MRNPTPVDLHLGGKLREARAFRHMSQEALGDAIGVTYQQIQKYEVGTNRLSAATLYRCSLALQVQPLWFYEGLTEPKAGEAVPPVDADQRKLLDAYDCLPTPVGRLLIGFVRDLAEGFRAAEGPSQNGVVTALKLAATS